MATLRIGLIGCGFNGRFHSRSIRNLIRAGLVGAEYVAVCDLEKTRAMAFAEAAGVEVVSNDPKEIIDSPKIDVVYICVPTADHKELVLRAAERGKHIFCEKPLATTLADVEDMVAAVESHQVKAGVGLILRHSPIITVLKSLTEDRTLGRLMTIVFRDDQFFPIQGHYDSDWRKDREIVGAGTLLEHSIHDIDVLRWLGGEVVELRASVRNFAGNEGVEDLAIAHLEFESGGQAQLISVWHSVFGRPSTRRLELFFENGLFTVDDDYLGPIQFQTHANNSQTLSGDEVWERYLALVGLDPRDFSETLGYTLEDYFFLTAASASRAPFPDFRVALEAHRVVDAAYRSAATGANAIRLA